MATDAKNDMEVKRIASLSKTSDIFDFRLREEVFLCDICSSVDVIILTFYVCSYILIDFQALN